MVGTEEERQESFPAMQDFSVILIFLLNQFVLFSALSLLYYCIESVATEAKEGNMPL